VEYLQRIVRVALSNWEMEEVAGEIREYGESSGRPVQKQRWATDSFF
jgi:hypothetical protein